MEQGPIKRADAKSPDRRSLAIAMVGSLALHGGVVAILLLIVARSSEENRTPAPSHSAVVELELIHGKPISSNRSDQTISTAPSPPTASRSMLRGSPKPARPTPEIAVANERETIVTAVSMPRREPLNLGLPPNLGHQHQAGYSPMLFKPTASNGAKMALRIPGNDRAIVNGVKFRSHHTHGECNRTMINGSPLVHCAPVEDDP